MTEKKNYKPPYEIGMPMAGMALGEVNESNSENYKKGDIVLSELSNESMISELNVLIDSIFKLTVSDLPKLYPAIKRGQPVKTKFVLPVLISTTD